MNEDNESLTPENEKPRRSSNVVAGPGYVVEVPGQSPGDPVKKVFQLGRPDSNSAPTNSQPITPQLKEELSGLAELSKAFAVTFAVAQEDVLQFAASVQAKTLEAGQGTSIKSSGIRVKPLMIPPMMIEGFSDLLESWVDSSSQHFDTSQVSYEDFAHLERVAIGLAMVANRFHGMAVDLFAKKRAEGYKIQRTGFKP